MNADTLAAHLAGRLKSPRLIIAGATAGVLERDGSTIADMTFRRCRRARGERRRHGRDDCQACGVPQRHRAAAHGKCSSPTARISAGLARARAARTRRRCRQRAREFIKGKSDDIERRQIEDKRAS